MKNLKNLAFGLLVAAFALGFSAFKPATRTSVYGKDMNQPTTQWIDLSGYQEVFHSGPLAPGEYRCNDLPETCTGVFDTQPIPGADDPAITEEGSFEYSPL